MGSWLPNEQWLPAAPPLTSTADKRSAAVYESILGQFGVASHKRYLPIPPKAAIPATSTTPAIPATGWVTYCNIYTWDVTRAMFADIPHWFDATTGAPVAVGKGEEQTANKLFDWLQTFGQKFSWTVETELNARKAAMMGRPAVATWKNPTGRAGHVAMVKPPRAGDMIETTWIAQAGLNNYEHALLGKGFGNYRPLFYVHP